MQSDISRFLDAQVRWNDFMISAFIHNGLLSILRLATPALVAGWVGSPMSWSPDSEWLCYTVVADAEASVLPTGWLFDSSGERFAREPSKARSGAAAAAGSAVYRIWASPRTDRPSVLVEESRWPLSAPAWSPRGRSVAFGRFAPQLSEPNQAARVGRWEVVIQTGLERKRVVWTSAAFAIDAEARAAVPHLACAWSQDGLYLAIPLPGPSHGVAIVRTDTKKQLHALERATLPVWSPDGSKCAFIRRENAYNSVELVERHGGSFGQPRALLETGPITAAPCWASDGRSIFVVVEKSAPGPHELELVRYVLQTGEAVRVLNLASDAGRRTAKVRGLAIDFDREAERCCFSVDLEGRETDLAWSIPRDREIQSRFSPLDPSQRIGALAVSPDGRMAAIRFGTPDSLSPPALFDSESQQTCAFCSR